MYDWRIRSRPHRWYLDLVRIKQDAAAPDADLMEQRARLDAVDAKLHTLKIPKSHLRDLYTLREHALYVRSTLDRA